MSVRTAPPASLMATDATSSTAKSSVPRCAVIADTSTTGSPASQGSASKSWTPSQASTPPADKAGSNR